MQFQSLADGYRASELHGHLEAEFNGDVIPVLRIQSKHCNATLQSSEALRKIIDCALLMQVTHYLMQRFMYVHSDYQPQFTAWMRQDPGIADFA